jgi:hypothetical protein
MLDLLGLLSKSAPNVHAFTSLDQNPLVYKVKLWHTEALKTADFLKIRIAAVQVDTVAGRPHQLNWRGVTLDAALRLSTPIARHQERMAEQVWLQLSALQGSLLEHRIFEQLFLVDSISADKGLQLARAQGQQF